MCVLMCVYGVCCVQIVHVFVGECDMHVHCVNECS